MGAVLRETRGEGRQILQNPSIACKAGRSVGGDGVHALPCIFRAERHRPWALSTAGASGRVRPTVQAAAAAAAAGADSVPEPKKSGLDLVKVAALGTMFLCSCFNCEWVTR